MSLPVGNFAVVCAIQRPSGDAEDQVRSSKSSALGVAAGISLVGVLDGLAVGVWGGSGVAVEGIVTVGVCVGISACAISIVTIGGGRVA